MEDIQLQMKHSGVLHEGNYLFMSYVNCLYFDPSSGVGSHTQATTSTLINTSVQAGSYHMCEIRGATVQLLYVT